MVSRFDIDWQDLAGEAAAEWVVRLHASVPEGQAEADWLAFEAWLDGAPGNRAAFDAAESLWSDIGLQALPIRNGLTARPTATIFTLPLRRPSVGPMWWATAAAAAAAVLLVVGPFSPLSVSGPSVYSTAKGERRSLTLADGSQVELNGNSQVSVIDGRRRREVDLAEGSEAAFSVVHDPSRPFTVRAGDRVIRDVGTEFDVQRNGGALKVIVRAGQVEVEPAAGVVGDTVALSAGRRLDHHQGAATSDVSQVNADDAFGWRSGRFIYRDRPLSEVVADLSRYYAAPVRTEGAAGALHFSGVLEIADEPAVINRLAALVPVSANRQDGVIVLRERAISR